MSSGLDTKRDFQVGLEMAWHKLTRIQQTIGRQDFPEVFAESIYDMDGKAISYNGKAYFVPKSADDGLIVSPPYCGDSFTLFTPRQGFDYVTEVIQGSGYTVQSLGMLKNRSRWFVSIHLDELKDVQIQGDTSKTAFQLNFSGGMDGSMSPQCELSATRVVCSNTLSLSRLTGEILFKSKLTKNFTSRLDLAKGEIDKAVGMVAIFNAQMSALANETCKPERAKNIFAGFLAENVETKLATNTRNTVDELTILHSRGDGNRGETLYDCVNAFTQLRTRGKADSKKDKMSQVESSEFGLYANQKAEFIRTVSDSGQLFQTENRGAKVLALS